MIYVCLYIHQSPYRFSSPNYLITGIAEQARIYVYLEKIVFPCLKTYRLELALDVFGRKNVEGESDSQQMACFHDGMNQADLVSKKNLESIYTALSAVKTLRSNVGQVFETLGNGLRADHGDEGKETKFLLELQDLLNTVNANLRDVDTAVASLTPPPAGFFNLGNSAFLNQECTAERQNFYGQLVLSYKWTDKIREYSTRAVSLLSQNSLKRSYVSSSNKRRRTQTSSHNVPPQTVDSVIATIDRLFNDMTVNVSRPFATNAVLQITLGRVLKAVIAFKGLMIEWVVVRGLMEPHDLWTESRHKVFRKVTENSHAAMLHFYSPTLPELAVRSFMTWFHSFNTLFNEPCKRCGNHLHSALPPTWRDFRTLEPFHEECKP